jgi:hypothetical protein
MLTIPASGRASPAGQFNQPTKPYFLFNIIPKLTSRVSRDSSVGIATRLRAGQQRSLGSCSLLHNVQARPTDHRASYKMGTWVVSPGVKRQKRVAHNSPPSSAEMQNGGAIPPLPHTPSWRDT